jgi:1-acyl-sn-glycerol-3-phosphate acyltransferase
MIASLIVGIVKLLCGARAHWQGCAPELRTRIYFANHTSHLDAVVLWAALPAPLRSKTRLVAAKDYWMHTALRRLLAERAFNALLIERKNVTMRDNPLEPMLDALDAGHSLIVFPEGTRSYGPEPQPFKSGLFHLARQRPSVELVPVLLENLNRVLPKGEALPVPMLGSVTIGTPIHLEANEAKNEFLERARLAVWNLHHA